LKTGDEVQAVSGGGEALRCRLSQADSAGAVLEVVEILPEWREPKRPVTLFQGLIRSTRMEQIVEQGTALGLARLVPLHTERVERTGLKRERLERIARETVKQCGRGRIPVISEPLQWERFMREGWECNLLVADAGAEQGLDELVVSGSGRTRGETAILIGPEGGLTDTELEAITRAGGIPVHLGPRRLRSETAAAAALTMLLIGSR
jgi:16S rRNA (uracil1498-N3)-methyltransferase